MRLHFVFELKDEIVPIDYRRKIISYLKFCIKDNNTDLYHELYTDESNKSKDFVISTYFSPETDFSNDHIKVKSKRMTLNLSTPDSYIGIGIYNALCCHKYVWYKLSDTNEIRLISINNEREKIITERKVVFHTMSPIVIRDHDKNTGKDWFYTFEDDGAAEVLKRNLKSEFRGKFDRDISYDIEKLQVTPVKVRKVIVRCYELKIPCTLGSFIMEGEPYLLQYFYQRGLGSKRSLGFGHLKLL